MPRVAAPARPARAGAADTVFLSLFTLFLMNRFVVFSLLLLAGAGVQHAAAQPSSGGPQPGAGPTATPLDGGASLLLAGGVAYGLRRLRQARRT